MSKITLSALALAMVLGFGTMVRADEPGFVGLQIQGVSNEIAAALGLEQVAGVLVRNVAQNGPADAGGLRRGDLIVGFAGEPIKTFEQLLAAVQAVKAGQTVEVEVRRADGPVTLTVEAGRWTPAWAPDKGATLVLAQPKITLASLSEGVRKRFKLRWESRGVAITEIAPALEALTSLRAGEVILQVNQTPVWEPAQVNDMIEQAKAAGRRSILLLVEGVDGFRFALLPSGS